MYKINVMKTKLWYLKNPDMFSHLRDRDDETHRVIEKTSSMKEFKRGGYSLPPGNIRQEHLYTQERRRKDQQVKFRGQSHCTGHSERMVLEFRTAMHTF